MDAKKLIESLSDLEKKDVLTQLCLFFKIEVSKELTRITVHDFVHDYGCEMSVRLFNLLTSINHRGNYIDEFAKWSVFKNIRNAGLKTWNEFYQLYYVKLKLQG